MRQLKIMKLILHKKVLYVEMISEFQREYLRSYMKRDELLRKYKFSIFSKKPTYN